MTHTSVLLHRAARFLAKWTRGMAFGLMVLAGIHAPASLHAEAVGYTVDGPHTHGNLSIFLIQGKETVRGKTYLTLEEAMKQKKIVVHETGDVNKLSVENKSGDDIYIQTGDIVKGGKQDRVLGVDLILPGKSGKVPIDAFCVESGRWRARGNEATTHFDSSSYQAASKDVKRAARYQKSQSAVWDNVSKTQDKLSGNVGGSVKSANSPTSLQLSQEDGKVKASIAEYVKALSGAVEKKKGVIGYAFSINGKINSADIYGSEELFRKLWPKLLQASATEAVAELQKGKPSPELKPAAVNEFLKDVAKGKAKTEDVSKRTKLITRETEKNISSEAVDADEGGGIVHSNSMTK